MNTNRYVLSTLSQHSFYYDEILKLIEEEFHYENENHFEIDFAPLLNPLNFDHCLIIIDTEKNKLAAHLAFNKRTMIKNKIEIPVVFIGGIVTKKEYRGENLFRRLMNHCFELNKHAGLFMLWSDIEGLYEKFNFYRAGGTIETGKNVITNDNPPTGFERTSFSKLSTSDFNTIQKIYRENIEEKFFTLKRQEIHWETIREMSSIDLFIKKNNQNEIIEYFTYGKGRDIPCVIHEVCSSNIGNLLEEISKFKVWLPETFLNDFPNHQMQYTAFVKIGYIEALNIFLKQVSQAYNDELKIISIYDHEVIFNFNNKEYNSTHRDFLQYLFGPTPLEEFKSFGLSPYIAGTDSV